MFRGFIVHGSVPFYLLICTLVPIVKDSLGNHSASDNYRAIAISSLFLKLFDWCILLLEGHKLDCHDLQYGFQAKTSTNMCSWALNSVIDYYNRSGTPIYGCTMDLSKAFDFVNFCVLFEKLKSRQVASIFLRTLLFIYFLFGGRG